MSKVRPGQTPFDPSRKGDVKPFARDQIASQLRGESILDRISSSRESEPTAEERKAERIEDIKARLVELYAGNETNANIFLHSPNPNLADRTPIGFMEQGDFRPVELLIHAMEHREMS
jgi:uncharacterized protein (DUF2384 family)